MLEITTNNESIQTIGTYVINLKAVTLSIQNMNLYGI